MQIKVKKIDSDLESIIEIEMEDCTLVDAIAIIDKLIPDYSESELVLPPPTLH